MPHPPPPRFAPPGPSRPLPVFEAPSQSSSGQTLITVAACTCRPHQTVENRDVVIFFRCSNGWRWWRCAQEALTKSSNKKTNSVFFASHRIDTLYFSCCFYSSAAAAAAAADLAASGAPHPADEQWMMPGPPGETRWEGNPTNTAHNQTIHTCIHTFMVIRWCYEKRIRNFGHHRPPVEISKIFLWVRISAVEK